MTFAGHACLHQARGALGENDLAMQRDVIAVSVRNEGECFCVPWVEPEIVLRQVDTAFVANLNHEINYARKQRNETLARRRIAARLSSRGWRSAPRDLTSALVITHSNSA